ncbi:TPA: hypothetical protein N0F65_010929 [Lagenidium giganteum]|uniref:Endonuclease/exonuclease/phosphatase domain-containing protein n=1 Tax=Lagenidium giganteum TaxID=4803 RepID=A0AAV2Z0A8_9STRA|nr:TPA: hypothetical protein N0F65_010929 [Lagenidium giganteum]
MNNFDTFFPSRSTPRNPYRHAEYKRPGQTLQDRFFVVVGTIVCFLLFITFTGSRTDSGVPPVGGAAVAVGGAGPRLKGGEAARVLSTPLNLKIMTFNLRFAGGADGYNSWDYRKAHLIELINRYHPAVMGTQEGLKDQLAEIAAKMEHPYDRFGIERETNGEFEQIFYDTSIVERLDGGNFWLSETPDEPGTKGWDAACVRLVTWCKFRILATKQEFFFFNTQLDHVGEQSRAEGSKLLWNRMKQITGSDDAPLFLLGDFNTYRHTSTYEYFTTPKGANLLEAWKTAEKTIGTVSYTYHGWAGVDNDGERGAVPAANHIDWIFYRPQMKVLTTEVITESRNGRYPSDHYPIQAEFLFPSAIDLPPPSAS